MRRLAVLLCLAVVMVGGCQPKAAPALPPPTPTPALTRRSVTAVAAAAVVNAVPTKFAQGTVRVGRLDRDYSFYVPATLPRAAPLVLVLHGAGMKVAEIRSSTQYEFEGLADRNGFIVVYPEGFQSTWNDCRKGLPLAARAEKIDDLGFIRALIARFQGDYGIDRSQVFVMGFSNGGHFAYRLAVELTDEIAAVAVVAANFPTDDGSDCRASGKPIPILIINGTSDPLNPYNGGLANFGASVRSARNTGEYFAELNGQTSPPTISRQDTTGPTSIERTVWNDPGKPEVDLVTVIGGTHTIPICSLLDGPAEIWDFFSRQRPLQ